MGDFLLIFVFWGVRMGMICNNWAIFPLVKIVILSYSRI